MKQALLRSLAGSLAGCWLLAGTAAIAADLPSLAPAAPPPVFTWTGVYVTAQVGGAWGGATVDINGWNHGFGDTGAFGGLNVGYNYQVGAVVLGLQAEYNFAGITGNAFQYPFGLTNSIRQFGSVDGRLGYAFNRFLVYAIGGFAYGDIRHSIQPAGDSALFFASNAYGWDVGGGLEYALTDNWTARVEYRYYNWGTKGFTESVGALDFPFHTAKETLQTARVGLTYKFGGPAAPVVARY